MTVVRSATALYNACHKVQNRLLPPVVVLAIVVLLLKWAAITPRGGQQGLEFTQLDDDDIQRYIGVMEDSRTEVCKHSRYTGLGPHTVSIILDYSDHEFYDLKLTLESLVRHTPEDLYTEIIILDDGTGHDHVMQDARDYLLHDKFKKSIRAFRSEKSEGPALSRFKSSRVAKGSILVFLSTRTAVNQGWLEPLLEEVKRDEKLIAVPHMDSLLPSYRYFATPDNLIHVFDWQLSTLFQEVPLEQEVRLLRTPVMTGDVFAVRRSFLDGIGNYDEGFQKGGGENLELSLRTWLCGGSLAVVPCSRVAVKDAFQPHRITSASNFRRVAELWLGPKYRRTAYQASPHGMDNSEPEVQSRQMRERYLEKHSVTCQSFSVYLRDTLTGLEEPPQDALHYGKLHAGSGSCVTGVRRADLRVRMTSCNPHMYEPAMHYSIDMHGRLRHGDMCVEALTEDKVTLRKCQVSQAWVMEASGLIKSAVHKDRCLMHTVSSGGEDYLDLQPCVDDKLFKWTFI